MSEGKGEAGQAKGNSGGGALESELWGRSSYLRRLVVVVVDSCCFVHVVPWDGGVHLAGALSGLNALTSSVGKTFLFS